MVIRVTTIDIGSILQPGNLIAWLLVGLIAGAVAGLLVRGRGFGCLGDIIVGLIGSVIGGVIASALDMGSLHFCGSVFLSVIGATILVAMLEMVLKRR